VSENSDGRYDITGALSDEKSLIIYKYLKKWRCKIFGFIVDICNWCSVAISWSNRNFWKSNFVTIKSQKPKRWFYGD